MITKPPGPEQVDINIEYAHIYADHLFGAEQERSIFLLRQALRHLRSRQQRVALAVLVDDYNPATRVLTEREFCEQLLAHGALPHFLAFESALPELAASWIGRLPRRDRLSIIRYTTTRGRVPCSVLIATWHLMRLGVIASDAAYQRAPELLGIADRHHGSLLPFVAREILTILPKRYESAEAQARMLMDRAGLGLMTQRMHYRFF